MYVSDSTRSRPTYIAFMSRAFFSGLKYSGGQREEMVVKAFRRDSTC